MAKIWKSKSTQQIVEVFLAISDEQTMKNFLRDVMTEKEIIEISSRFEAAKMLKEGKKYTEIIEKTKLSSRTVARISEWMRSGEGGYEAALGIVSDHHDHMSPVRAE